MRPIPRRRAASNTLTVPTTFTFAPATGSALQKGTCRPARWITAQGRTASKIWTTVLLSEMSPVRHRIFSRSASSMSRRGRRLSSDKSSAHAGTPARTSSASTQLPMQPPAPVTTTGPGKLARSIEKRSVMRIPLTTTVGAANLPRPLEIFPKTRRPGKSSTRMASVTLSGVRKSFGSTEVVHGVDIGVEDGEFCVLVGPSGCGKSTLLRMIAGLEEISGGRIAIGERVVNGVAPKERDIAMVFQNYALYPHMNVYDNMAFSLKLAGESREHTRLRVEEAAVILGLEEYLRRYPRQLSGGQRQRVAMGRAIVRKPQVFLFDEPLSNLDAKLRVAMRTEIKALHQRLKTTSVYVTHDQIEAMTMADKIVVMNAGRVEQIGDPLSLYDRPNNTFVAGFIGSPAMNMVPGTARMNGAGRRIEFAGGVTLPLPLGADAADGQAVLYGIRPEHCLLA